MVAITAVADVLGLPARLVPDSPIRLMESIEHGLPIDSLERVSRLVAPDDGQFKFRIVPRATYGRRKDKKRLSVEEGTRLARLARIWGLAVDVWGNEEDARAFLFRAHPMLEDKRPIEVVLQGEFGAELVIDILASLKYGSAA